MAEESMQGLIEALRDYRLRSNAIGELVAMGDAAVAPLTSALHAESQEGARRAILRCLRDLRAQEAVEHVAPLLEERQFRDAAYDALVGIVGEDLGPAAQPWLKWAGERRSGAAPAQQPYEPEMHVSGLPDERLMELALKGCGASWHKEAKGRFALEVPLEAGGPARKLAVNLTAKDHEGADIVIVYADCGPASAEHYEGALRRNLHMPYGALAVRDAAGQPRFVMFNALLREDMSPLELRKSILSVAERAARVKQELEQ